MKVSVIHGGEKPGSVLDKYVQDLKARLEKEGHEVKVFVIRDLDIHDCAGCWSCWWKTPGLCAFDDAMTKIYPAYLSSAVVFLATPLLSGFVSSLLKKTMDRLIPVAHPYITIKNKESAHYPRYKKYPAMAGLFEFTAQDTAQDKEININYIQGVGEHLFSHYMMTATTDTAWEEVQDAINRL